MYTVSQKAASETFCDIFTRGEPFQLKIILVVAQLYSYVCTDFDSFIWILSIG